MIPARLDHERRARGEDGVVEYGKFVHASTDEPAKVIGNKDLVLNVEAQFIRVWLFWNRENRPFSQ